MEQKVKLKPTPEQEAVIEASVTTKDNLIIEALAGAAKTTTLEMIAGALPSVPIISIAFNKRIADEMAKRLPGNVKAATINSVGHGVWRSAIGSNKLSLDTKKSYNIVKLVIESLPKRQREDAYEEFADILRSVRQAKSAGYVPPSSFGSNKSLLTHDEFFGGLEEEPTDLHMRLVNDALLETIKQGYAGLIDFDDQIYLPTLFGGVFPKFPLVLADEVQDFSPLNHAFIKRLVTNRLIGVGDGFQSIYAFRGAMTNSMDQLKSTFDMRSLSLSVSFRCPQRVVEAARFRAPNMQWAPWAKEGLVETLKDWNPKDIPDGAAILCRNNAPLFGLALQLIRGGRGVKLVGTDLGPQLVKALKKLGDESLTRDQVHQAIDTWQMERLARSRDAGATSDKADCLRVFANYGQTLGESIAYAEHLFAANGPVQLMSVHKSKGLEFGTVYLLDEGLIPSRYAKTQEALTQEENIRYVAYTRAKENLYKIRLEDLDVGT